ncbi:transposase, Mutator family protein, partial [Mycobacterium sp. MAC_080597_8934]
PSPACSAPVPQGRNHVARARADITAFTDFPVAHWKKIWSTNPLSVNRLSGDTVRAAA